MISCNCVLILLYYDLVMCKTCNHDPHYRCIADILFEYSVINILYERHKTYNAYL